MPDPNGIGAAVAQLAARHGRDVVELMEDWHERAAIREYLGGDTRRGAELAALHEIERMHKIGLGDPETLRRWAAGGDRGGTSQRGAA